MKAQNVVSARLIIGGVAIGAALWGYLVVVFYALGRIPALSQASILWDASASGTMNDPVSLLVSIAASMAYAIDDVVAPRFQGRSNSLVNAIIRGLLPGLIGGSLGIERANAAGVLTFGLVRTVFIVVGFLAASILCFFAFTPKGTVLAHEQG